MKITIIGTGYVGLITGSTLAYFGNEVTAIDTDCGRLACLRAGQPPFHEPGLDALLRAALPNLDFSDDTQAAVAQSELVFITVGTPSLPNGHADLRFVDSAVMEAARGIRAGQQCTFVTKSTVPIGTNRWISTLVRHVLEERGVEARVFVASNPEFLREGEAIRDMLFPDRIVVGTDHRDALRTLGSVYAPILSQTFESRAFAPRPHGYEQPRWIATDTTSAEMIKYAANAFLALKVSFINEISGLCECLGADVNEVARGIGSDRRIGHRFLRAGLGWGGSCFPKDTAALIALAQDHNYTMPIIQASREVNERQWRSIPDKLRTLLGSLEGKQIVVLGLSYKPNTDDIRDSPALSIIRSLVEQGARVRAHDPVAIPASRKALADLEVRWMDDPLRAAVDADAVVLTTGWSEYRDLDLQRLAGAMRSPVLVDGVNLLRPELAWAAGLYYSGVGNHGAGSHLVQAPPRPLTGSIDSGSGGNGRHVCESGDEEDDLIDHAMSVLFQGNGDGSGDAG